MFMAVANFVSAQNPLPARGRQAPLVSPEIHPDRTVTFRVRAPNATNVTVSGESFTSRNQMSRDDNGIWSATVGPLEPNLYSYSVTVDGFRTADTANPEMKPETLPTASMFEVPADKPQIYDFQPVPHGTVCLHEYDSKSLGKLRKLRVYTPPGYEKNPRARFPVLYLFHGAGDNEATWSEFGHAQLIVDNLLSQGKAVPMIIVMPQGHASFATPPAATGDTNAPRNRNLAAFEADLLHDVMPFIEENYRTKADRDHRAIIGLSMGGGESLSIGLRHLELFAWVGGMSSAVPDQQSAVAGILANSNDANKKLKLLWFACGKADALTRPNQQLDDLLSKGGVKHQFIQTEGAHEWPVWRRNLADFVPLIFAGK